MPFQRQKLINSQKSMFQSFDVLHCDIKCTIPPIKCVAALYLLARRLLSVLQCVAVCCRVLQCVAVCCSVLQCVAESRKDFGVD